MVALLAVLGVVTRFLLKPPSPTVDSIAETAISYFTQAIEKDPGYALAYAGLADVYSVTSNYGMDPNEVYPKSKAAAMRASRFSAASRNPAERPGESLLFP